MSHSFEIHVVDGETLEDIDCFEIEVEDAADVKRLTHPMAAQEYAEQIQSIISDFIEKGWKND